MGRPKVNLTKEQFNIVSLLDSLLIKKRFIILSYPESNLNLRTSWAYNSSRGISFTVYLTEDNICITQREANLKEGWWTNKYPYTLDTLKKIKKLVLV